jgi:RecA-family ATPase
LLINNEDDAEELELRFRAIIKQCQLSAAEVDLMRSNIHYQSGYHQQLKLAYTGPDKIVRATQLKKEIINYCLQQKIDALMVDPLVSLHDVSENDNGMMNAVMSEIKSVASYAGVGVMLLHHTKKLSGEKIDTDESLRGASSVKDAARVIYLLSRMTAKEATDCGITSQERPRYIRLDDGKANYALPSGVANWYYLHSVGFDAVDEDGHSVSEYVGVPEPVKVNKVTADSDPAVEEKKKDATIKTITKALDDKTWPVKTSDYSAMIKKVIGKGNRAALDAIQLFPLIEKGATDDEIKLESELTFLEQGRFRVWRQKGANQATFLHRKTAEGEW